MATSEQDVETAIELGRALHAESQFRDMPYNPDKLRALGTKVLSGNHGYLLILAERDGVATGFILAKLDRHFFSDALAMNVLVLYVEPVARNGLSAIKLLHVAKSVGKRSRVKSIYISSTVGFGDLRFDKFMKKIGCKRVGSNYSIEV
tara:strand:+ start:484 stop:927 length:444 start_codon:yes stop_codon:yes gene_type:complete